ncbi:MAG: TIGR03790 family protein [Lentimonas sp.]
MSILFRFLFIAAASIDVAFAFEEASRVVIVVNANEPDSRVIGDYYAEKRGIPKENIIELSTSREETITPKEYVETIYNPFLTKLIAGGWVEGVRSTRQDRYGRLPMSVAVNSISYVVTIKGIPLRISNDPTLFESAVTNAPKHYSVNQAAVDNELGLLLAPGNLSMTSLIPNPLYNQKNPSAADLSRILRVSRLDGPDARSVKRVIDRTLEAEEIGLMGRAYIDIGGPHAKGDEWFNAAADFVEAAYFDTDIETSKREIDMYSRYDAPAIYLGWYRPHASGPWAQPRWSVPAGAIAYHLHSFSAITLRNPRKGWLGAFVKQGYCASVGTVYEPYLEQTHRPHDLIQHLLEGHTFGEAVLYSYSAFSWMGVAIGDPLYRPFKVDLRKQLSRRANSPFSSYVHLREINRLKSEAGADAALAYARRQYVEQPSLALAYKLAQLFIEQGQKAEAAQTLKIMRYITEFSEDEQILAKEIADLLHSAGEPELALEIYERLIAQRNLNKTLRIVLLRGGAKVTEALGNAVQSSRWNLEARQLAAPPQKKKPVSEQ